MTGDSAQVKELCRVGLNEVEVKKGKLYIGKVIMDLAM